MNYGNYSARYGNPYGSIPQNNLNQTGFANSNNTFQGRINNSQPPFPSEPFDGQKIYDPILGTVYIPNPNFIANSNNNNASSRTKSMEALINSANTINSINNNVIGRNNSKAELNEALLQACGGEKCSLDKVSSLVESGAQVNQVPESGYSPLCLASSWNHADIVDYLISKNANVNIINKEGLTPLGLAVKQQLKNIATILLNKGATIVGDASIIAINKTDLKPLFQYSCGEWGNLHVVKMLINVSNSNYPLTDNNFPLHYAAGYNHVDIIEHLIFKGAKVDFKNNDGKTPLANACNWGHINSVKALLKKGADPTKVSDAIYDKSSAEIKSLIRPSSSTDKQMEQSRARLDALQLEINKLEAEEKQAQMKERQRALDVETQRQQANSAKQQQIQKIRNEIAAQKERIKKTEELKSNGTNAKGLYESRYDTTPAGKSKYEYHLGVSNNLARMLRDQETRLVELEDELDDLV